MPTIASARQAIRHGHIVVDGFKQKGLSKQARKRIDCPSQTPGCALLHAGANVRIRLSQPCCQVPHSARRAVPQHAWLLGHSREERAGAQRARACAGRAPRPRRAPSRCARQSASPPWPGPPGTPPPRTAAAPPPPCAVAPGISRAGACRACLGGRGPADPAAATGRASVSSMRGCNSSRLELLSSAKNAVQ